ncbi:MAG TPA: hypothetical protein VGM11_02330 [Acidobacteriaceae bacterium]|jgi:hypothetical protein
MSLEGWAEHHQLVLWSVALFIAILLGMKESVRAIAAATPRGLRAVRVARLTSLVRSLERYSRDRSVLMLDIIRDLTFIGFYIFCYSEFLLLRYGYPNFFASSIRAELTGPPEKLIVNIYILLCGLFAGMLMVSMDLMFLLWKYRSPANRLPVLKRKLAQLSLNSTADELNGAGRLEKS